MRPSLALGPILLLAACDRGASPAPASASVTVSVSVSASASVTAPDAPAIEHDHEEGPGPGIEAQRRTLQRLSDDRALAAHASEIQLHFGGGKIPTPLDVQTARLDGDRRAVLLDARTIEGPMLVVHDGAGHLLWSRDRPLAGTRQNASDVALLAGPRGGVAIAWFDAPTRLAALRTWDAAGVVLADFRLFAAESCDAIAAVHWPGRGFLVVGASPEAARAQLLDRDGALAWGKNGLDLPWASNAAAPVTIAFDTDDSVVLIQAGYPRSGPPSSAPDRAMAMRYGAAGEALWDRPIEIGRRAGDARARIEASRAAPGVVRVALGPVAAMEVTSAGEVSAPRRGAR